MIGQTEKKHIVVVDDEPVNLELAERALGGKYRLTKLISGAQLLTFLTRVKPDMILLDVQMPGMNGYEVIGRIMENPEIKNIPIIFLTGQDSLASEKKCLMLGAKDFIRKPFDSEIMLARVRSQMELYLYRTGLESIIVQNSRQISELQHLLTISIAEMIESRDGTTGSHVRNTTAYFELLIKALAQQPAYTQELNDEVVGDLLKASTLHDIGKIGISDAILKKPGPLDKEEFTEMKRHSEIGSIMIEKIVEQTSFDSFLSYAKEMAWFHHERWDGTGYPCGLKGQLIPAYVRALSIVDVYDALTSVRPYKRAFSHEEALEIITQDNGKFFDPAIYDTFISIQSSLKSVVKEGA